MNVLIMGAAGSGKGTMAEKIIEKYHIPHISTGSMFRTHIYAQTPLGLLAQSYIDKGKLVPDDVTIEMVRERLLEQDCKKGYLLDGFPRTLPQAEAFEEISITIDRPVQAVLNLQVNLDDLKDRVLGRRLCRNCGAIYHITNDAPKVEGVCDYCNHKLIHRSDDTAEQLGTRLQEHVLMTQPVLSLYRAKHLVYDVNASQEIEKVFIDIDQILRALK